MQLASATDGRPLGSDHDVHMAEGSSRNRHGVAIGTRDHLEQGLGRLRGCQDIASVGQDQDRAGDLGGIGHLPIEYQVTAHQLVGLDQVLDELAVRLPRKWHEVVEPAADQSLALQVARGPMNEGEVHARSAGCVRASSSS
jgi:hypothetical protein